MKADRHFSGRSALLALLAAIGMGVAPVTAESPKPAPPVSESWAEIKAVVFGDRPIRTDSAIITLEAPKRAQDAALVPVDIRTDPALGGDRIKQITLIIDENPAPVAAVFEFGKDAGVTHLSTRVRVDEYTYMRAIAELDSGELFMAERYIKASGGCGAPALKNPDAARAEMGQMKLKQFPAETGMTTPPELQLMIRHPNNTGFQMDQVTRYFIPPHFVHEMTISQGDHMILKMEGGISISEDPNFRFDFRSNGETTLSVVATDTDGQSFKGEWPLEQVGL